MSLPIRIGIVAAFMFTIDAIALHFRLWNISGLWGQIGILVLGTILSLYLGFYFPRGRG